MMVDHWAALDRYIDNLETKIAPSVNRVEDRERERAEISKLRRDFDHTNGFRNGAGAVVDAMASDPGIPVLKSLAMIKTHADMVQDKHGALLLRAMNIFIRCQTAPRAHRGKVDESGDTSAALHAVVLRRLDPTLSEAKAIQIAIVERRAQGEELPALSPDALRKRISRLIKAKRDELDGAAEALFGQ